MTCSDTEQKYVFENENYLNKNEKREYEKKTMVIRGQYASLHNSQVHPQQLILEQYDQQLATQMFVFG